MTRGAGGPPEILLDGAIRPTRPRDDGWLIGELDRIWAAHFADVPRVNTVQVWFNGFWKSRLGLITLTDDAAITYIQVNTLLRAPEVPPCVASVTVAHEMVHYAHGFGSPLPRRYKHPHRGGIVERELRRRGMGEEYDRYDHWVYNHWYEFYDKWVTAADSHGVVDHPVRLTNAVASSRSSAAGPGTGSSASSSASAAER